MKENELKDIVVIYHAHCQDGFGSAFAAWKKFGDNASYITSLYRTEPPEGLVNKEIYIVDFSYPKEVLLDLESKNKRLVVIDHHFSAKEAVESVKEHIFSLDHAASYLSWEYFVGGGVPELIKLLEIIDTAKDKSGYDVYSTTYILSRPFTFSAYEELLKDFEDTNRTSKVKELGKVQHEYVDSIIESIIYEPDMVEFEGHIIPAVNMSLPINEKSIAIAKLYTRYPPFAMSYRFDNGLLKVSLRGDGTIDLLPFAEKYGGGGHKSSCGFVIPIDYPLPFAKKIKESE